MVAVDGVADGFAPGVGAESVDVFVLGEVDGLHESLRQVGDRAKIEEDMKKLNLGKVEIRDTDGKVVH